VASKYVLVETVEELQAYFGAGLLHFRYRDVSIGEGYQQEFETLWVPFKRDWENRNSWDYLVEEDVG
jgi:hypothetical protein